MEIKVTKIGGSNYVIVPHEYIKVHNLENAIYKLEVLNNGKTLVYRQILDVENLPEEENIPKEKIDEIIAEVEKEEQETPTIEISA